MLVQSSAAQVPSTVATSGSVVQKILEIQEELVMINKHKREHGTSVSNDSCVYCQRRRQLLGEQETGKAGKGKRRMRTLNEIERSVDLSGKNGCVILPRSWAGKRVKIILLDEKS